MNPVISTATGYILGAWAALLTLGLWAALWATARHFKSSKAAADPVEPAERLPRATIIRPIRGLNEGMESALLSLAEADPGKNAQIIIAMESQEDPAYPVARAFAESQAEKGRDVSVVLTGPSRDRMGKIHNMIEALPKAKHPFVIFSDADAWADPELLGETLAAFSAGHDAVFALPYCFRHKNLADFCFTTGFNHGFSAPAALCFRLFGYPFCAGAWMAFSKKALEKIGGLESFSRQIADDYALGTTLFKSGGKCLLLRRPVLIRETTRGVRDAFRHFSKWFSIIRCCLSGPYWALPLASPAWAALGFGALALRAGLPGAKAAAGALIAAVFLSRMIVGLIQDLKITGRALPLYAYAAIPFFDLTAPLVWLSGFRRTIEWRDKRYRLGSGCRSEVIRDSP